MAKISTTTDSPSRSGCRRFSIAIFVAILSSIALIIGLVIKAKTPPTFAAHRSERDTVVSLIESGQLPSTEIRIDEGQDITYSTVLLPEKYKDIARDRNIKIARKENILEVAFLIQTWKYGDGTLYFVYRSDSISDKTNLFRADDFLLFGGANFFEAEALAPHWYRIAEEW